MVMADIANVEERNLALGRGQVEEQLSPVRRGGHVHQGARAQNVSPDRSPNPPYGIGREPEALFGLEALDRPHQADIALRDEIRDWQAVAAIASGDLGDES
jgi:hypothetical protein